MGKIKVELKDYYIIGCVFTALAVMALCYLHREMVNGVMKFVPRIPGKEWSTVATMLFMKLFASKIVQQDKAKIVEHVCGFTIITLFALAGVFEYFQINPGQFYWGLIGSVLGIWAGASGSGT